MVFEMYRDQHGFDVIGIMARTTSQAEMHGNGVITQLWQRFFVDNILAKIPNKVDNTIYALYYDYESDKDGAYNILIGARVSSIIAIPAGMVAQFVPAEKRAVFITDKGQIGHVVVDAWKKIWNLEEKGELKRSYTIDYQLHDERSLDPNDAQAEIHIAVVE